ncbi:MAG: hypothetical protein KC502_07065 [Myxococcales bacterium]|nr:hypothetical protein [Myxococcales bacterium]
MRVMSLEAQLRVAAILIVALAAGCSTSDSATPGPDGFADSIIDTNDGGIVDTDGTDAGPGVDTQNQAQVDFHLKLKTDEVLKGSDSVILPTTQDTEPDEGFQADVVVTGTNLAEGTEITVTVAGKAAGSGTLSQGSVTITKVTIPCSAVASSIVVSVANGPSKTKSALVNCSNACTASLTKPADCHTTDADPNKDGFQVALEVETTTPDCSHAYIKFTGTDGTASESDKVALSGQSKVTVVVTLAANATGLSNASAQVQAIVEDQAFPERPKGTSLEHTVKLTTEAPVLQILQPSAATVTLADDANGNPVDGIQLNIVGTASTMQPLEPVEVTVNGVDAGKANIGADGNSFKTTLTFDKSQAYKIEVKGTNSCGLSGATDKTITAFVDQTALVISQPTPNAVLLAKNDGDTKTPATYETNVIVNVAKGTPGDTVSVFCRTNAVGSAFEKTPVGTATYPAGASGVSVLAALDTDVLGTAIVCRASIDGANPASSPEIAFVVGLPAPCLKVLLPTKNAAVKGAALPLTVTATNLDGRVVEAKLSVKGGSTFVDAPVGKISQGSMTVNVSLQKGNPAVALPDGTYVLTLGASDAFGNLAKESVCSDLTRTFTLDNTGPKVAITAPTKTSLDPVVDADTDAKTPGYQTNVSISVSGETGESIVCLTVGAFNAPCQKVTGAGSVTFSSVSLQPGANSLVVTATDSLGNKTTNSPATVTLISNAVVVSWLDPASNKAIASDTITVKAKISNQKDGTAITGAKVVVYVGGKAQPAVSVTESAGGQYSATVAGLTTGKNTIQFVATPAGGGVEGVSPLLTITYKVGTPTVTITSPSDKTSFNIASSACLVTSKDCKTSAQIQTSNAADGSAVELNVTCGSSKKTFKGSVKAGKATIADVIFTHGQSCTAIATVTDEAGQSADSSSIGVSVDRVAPVIASLNPSKTSFLSGDDFNSNPADGIQINLSASVSGLAKDAPISLEVYDDDGKKVKTYTSKPHPAIPETSFASVDFEQVTLPDGFKLKLKFATADAAGNKTTLDKTVSSVANAPEVRLTSPPYIETKSCTSNAACGVGVCVGGKCATGWNKLSSRIIGFSTLGLLPGSKARVCSNNASVTGNGACATPGFNAVAASAQIEVTGGLVDVSSLKDGDHTFIVEVILPNLNEGVAGNWVSSTKSPLGVTVRSRRIVVDTVAPSIKSILAPSKPGVPTGCLAAASQTDTNEKLPGGTFSFAATTTGESANITIFNGSKKVGSQDASGATTGVAVTLPAGKVALKAMATDAVGNESAAFDVGSFTVNTVAPIGQFVQPNKAVLVKGDALDVKFTSSSNDVEGTALVLSDAGKVVGTETMTKGVATFAHATHKALSDGTHTLTAKLVDTCGNEVKVGTVPSEIKVDTTEPTATITAPTQGQVFGDNDDASASAGGYQVNLTFGTASGAATWKVDLGSECDATYKNCSGFKSVGAGKVTNADGNEPTVAVTIPFGKSDNFVARVTVTDDSGNTASVDRGFKVKLTGCKVLLTGLPASGKINTQFCPTKGSDCASVKLNLTAEYLGPCGNVTEVRLLKGSATAASATPSDSKASLTLDVKDGDDTKIEALVFAKKKQNGSSGATSLRVDLSNPKVAFVATKVLGFDTAASGATANYGASADQDNAQNGTQVHAAVLITDGSVAGGQITKLENTQGSATTLSSALKLPFALSGTAKQQVEIKFISLPTDATSKVTVTVADAMGNVGSASFTAITDAVGPAAPTLGDITAADVNPRRPFVKLKFKAVADNGSTGSAAKSYEVRYSRSNIASATDFDKACDAASLTASTISAPKAPGADEVLTVEGPDGRAYDDSCKFATMTDNGASKFYFAVRAIDAAGNKGAISNVVSTSDVRLRYAKLTATVSPYKSNFAFAYPYPIGDFNGDGKQDAAVAGIFGARLCVLFGHADKDGIVGDYDITAQTGASHACLNNTTLVGLLIASAVDVNGDGFDDLVVDADSGKGKPRSVHIYLGNKAGTLSSTPQVKVTNITNNGSYGVKALTAVGNFNGDTTSGGTAIGDIAFTVTATATKLYERVVILPGNSAWSASSAVTIDVESAADRKTHNMVTVHRSDSAGKPDFGYRLHKLGNFVRDTDGSGKQFDELVISQYANTQTIYIVKGREVSGDTTLTVSKDLTGSGSADKTTLALRPGNTGANNPRTVIPVHFDGDNQLDLMFSHNPYKQLNTLYWVRGKDAASKLGKVTVLALTAINGVANTFSHKLGYAYKTYADPIFSLGNFGDQQGKPATTMASTLPSYAPGGRTTVTVRQPIARPDKATGTEPSYHVADLIFGNPFAAGTQTMGAFTAAGLGDFNGDGYPDMVIGTYKTGYTVLVY